MRSFVVGRRVSLSVFALFFAAVLVISVAVAAGNMGIAASAQQQNLPIYSVETDDKVIALGINCAWDDSDISQLLQILAAEDIKATFFVVGEWCEKYPEALKAIHAAGHEIGNHSYSHPDMTTLSAEEIKDELNRCSEIVESLIGEPTRLFRAPSGAYNDMVVQVASSMGYYVIQWDADSIDWKNPSPEEMKERILAKAQNGSITLFHSGAQNTPAALPAIISALKAEGYTFEPVSKLIYTENYTIDHTGRQHKKD